MASETPLLNMYLYYFLYKVTVLYFNVLIVLM